MDNIIYIKYSNDRADRFKISTRIEEKKDGTRAVYKKAENNLAIEHIEKIYENYVSLSQFVKDINSTIDFTINKCERAGSELKFEYVKGDNYQKKLCSMYVHGDTGAFYSCMDSYVNCLRNVANQEFEYTEQFKAIFGEYDSDRVEYSMPITNIDFNFDNILLTDSHVIIDYEWVYDFPIPVDYVIYRALNYLAVEIKGIEGNPYELLTRLAERYDIGEKQIDKYVRMEQNFLRYVNGSTSTLRDLFQDIGKRRPTLYDLLSTYEKEYNNLFFQVYYNYGSGYCDEHIVHVEQDENGRIDFAVEVPNGATGVRIDPGNNCCMVIMDNCNAEYSSNGYNLNINTMCFNTEDPQIFFDNVSPDCTNINISIRFVVLKQDISRQLIEIVEYIAKSREKLLEEVQSITEENDREISSMQTLIEKLQSENELLNETNEGLEREMSNMQTILEQKDKEIQYCNSENERKTKDFQAQIEVLNNTNVQLSDDNKNLSSQITVLNNRIHNLEVELSIKQNECDGYLNSGSWKITAPMRKIRRFALKYLNNRYTRQFMRGVRSLRNCGVRKTFIKVKWWIRKKRGAHTVTIGDFIAMPGVTADILTDVPEIVSFNKSIAVQLHLYYEELLAEFCQYLGNMPFAFDLYISCRQEANASRIKSKARKIRNVQKVVVQKVPNRGRDIAPIFVWFADELKNYDYLIHMHSKKSLYTGNEKLGWRQYSLDSLLGDERLIRKYFGVLENNNVGILYPDNHEDVPALANTWLSNEQEGRKLLAQFGIPFETGFFNYPAGSFYIAKVEAIRSLFERGFTIEDFPEENGQTDGTLAHAIERGIVFFAKQRGLISAIVDYRENALRYEWSYKAFRPHFNNKKEGVIQYLSQFDVISFDIFDTLITRMILRPDDVFAIMREKIKEQYGIECDYLKVRKEAEQRAFEEKGWFTNIHDIYNKIPDVLGVDKTVAAALENMEIAVEYEIAIPRRDVLDVFNSLKEQNKKIILVSDMYLTGEIIEKMLNKCGYSGWNELYVSCENGLRKDCNTVWDELLKNNSKSFIHVGDNPHSDWQTVVDRHIASLWVVNPMDAFKMDSSYRTLRDILDGTVRIEDSILLGMLVNGALYNSPWKFDAASGCVQMTDAWTMGYTCFGPILTNYVKNIDINSEDDQILLFLAREGFLLQKLYKEYHLTIGVPEKENYYFEASRRCVTVAASKTEQDVREVIGQNYGGALSNLVRSRLGFELPKEVEDRRIDLSPGDKNRIDEVMKLLEPYMPEIFKQFEEEREAYTEYIKSIAVKEKWNKMKVLDVGYSGTIQYFLSKLLDEKISGYYLATFTTKPDRIGCKCNAVYDKDYARIGVIDRTQLFLESALQAPYGQLVKCRKTEEGIEFVKKRAEKVNDGILELQRGIMDFCHQFGCMVSLLENKCGDVDDIIMRLHELFLHGGYMTYEMADVYSVEDDYCSNKTLKFLKDMDRWNNF